MILSGILDRTLQLGAFHGLVFFLYSYYGLAGVAFVTLIIAGVKQDKEWLLGAGAPISMGIILFLIQQLVQ